MTAHLDRSRHPCFNADIKGRFGRIHVPVAPECNIQCRYCDRKNDCVNESRPGVSSAVLSPSQAERYVLEVLEREPRIAVLGIAGPGDPFANAAETLETLRRVRNRFPDMLLCVATNGLGLPPHLDDLAVLGVTHVTVTVNAVDPAIGASIYRWVRWNKRVYRGTEAAAVLLDRQREAIGGLKDRGITVKVNTIVIPGINDTHVEAVAREAAALGADILNCMPMVRVAETPFASIPEPDEAAMARIRAAAAVHMPQMRHCTRCRADAVGLLGSDRSSEFRSCLKKCSQATPTADPVARPYVAVASQEGVLVNQHLGEAVRLQIWGRVEGGYVLVAERQAPEPGGGRRRWRDLAAALNDCRAVLASGMGDSPREVLREYGILPVVMEGFIRTGLETIFEGGDLRAFRRRREGGTCGRGNACSGDGAGCH